MQIQLLSPREFEQFRGFIYRESGIRIADGKVSLLSNRIRRRLKACEVASFREYFRLLTSSKAGEELQYFLDAVTTNETFFFRTPAHFQWLTSSLVPEMSAAARSGQRDPSLRIWSAACASGAEAWSIAFCLDACRFQLRDWSISILGTDINETEICAARKGKYPARVIESLTDAQKRRYFAPVDNDMWQIRPRYRQMAEFALHNLMQPLNQPPFDCIFLCNVLIYFDAQSRQTVIDQLTRSLLPGGYLVTGPSEGVYGMLDSFQKVAPMVYRKPVASELPDPGDTCQGCKP